MFEKKNVLIYLPDCNFKRSKSGCCEPVLLFLDDLCWTYI